MASGGKKKTTMGKLNRERRLQERRLDKRAKKEARKHAASHPDRPGDGLTGDVGETLSPRAEQPSAQPLATPDRS